jgi:ribonuclease D
MTVFLYQNDLPDDVLINCNHIAIDTETMGLNPLRDRLCVVQLSSGDGVAHLVQFDNSGIYEAPNLKALLLDDAVQKIFHFARFDLLVLYKFLNTEIRNLYCTKIASKLVRTFTDRHGLRDLAKDLIGVEISKQQQTSDWGAETLTEAQQLYAAGDVLYLHQIKNMLDAMLLREGRRELAHNCFEFLTTRMHLDLLGWNDTDKDFFSHS